METLRREKCTFSVVLLVVSGCIMTLTYTLHGPNVSGPREDSDDFLVVMPRNEEINKTTPRSDPIMATPKTPTATHGREHCSNEQRKVNMREACSRHQPVLDKSYRVQKNTYTHLFVDDRHKVLFCAVPKAGCTSWKNVMALQSGKATEKMLRGDFNKVHRPAAARALGLRRFREDSITDIQWKLKNYTKVMVVRNPLSRLFSAYVDKFVYFYRTYAKKIHMPSLKRYFKNLPVIGGETFISFPQFAEAVAMSFQGKAYPRLAMDEHWRPIHKICYPCHIQYDYIGKIDSISEDAGPILKLFNASRLPQAHAVSGSGQQRNIFNVSKISEEQAFGMVPPEITEQLIKAYSIDFDLLGYGMDTSPTCGFSSGDSTCC